LQNHVNAGFNVIIGRNCAENIAQNGSFISVRVDAHNKASLVATSPKLYTAPATVPNDGYRFSRTPENTGCFGFATLQPNRPDSHLGVACTALSFMLDCYR
jgi:hypothetical protein